MSSAPNLSFDLVSELVGESSAMRSARVQLARWAPFDTTVLITGETGTGKGLAARALHRLSGRPGPLVHADCAALATGLLESELFGHERGAFTGAHARHAGRLERCAHGTLFLDEVGELRPDQQVVLLRVLQDRSFERVGGSDTLRLRGRVVAATSRDLPAEVRGGRFRADLYYRLAVARLVLPPLRDRPEDVPLLFERALRRCSSRLGLPLPRCGASTRERIASHPWPGNVRELENLAERVVLQGGDCVDAGLVERLLDSDVSTPEPTERRIAHALRETRGNVAAAARRLGMPRTTLRRRLAEGRS